MISAEEIKALMANKKTRMLIELAKASKHYGKEFVYTATNESELLNGWSNVQEATSTSCKKLNIVDLAQEMSQELDSKVQALSTLQTLLNQAAGALFKIRGFEESDWDSENPHDYVALFEAYVETREIAKQALAAIQPYLTKEGE